MARVLTSWKEIGQYLGKGVRTVQRWELEFALPVRRPAGRARHAVFAIPDELDTWTNTRTKGPGIAVAECLRKELAALREETADLRRRLEIIEKTIPFSRQYATRSPSRQRSAISEKPVIIMDRPKRLKAQKSPARGSDGSRTAG